MRPFGKRPHAFCKSVQAIVLCAVSLSTHKTRPAQQPSTLQSHESHPLTLYAHQPVTRSFRPGIWIRGGRSGQSPTERPPAPDAAFPAQAPYRLGCRRRGTALWPTRPIESALWATGLARADPAAFRARSATIPYQDKRTRTRLGRQGGAEAAFGYPPEVMLHAVHERHGDLVPVLEHVLF
jgi:hypothetical protein